LAAAGQNNVVTVFDFYTHEKVRRWRPTLPPPHTHTHPSHPHTPIHTRIQSTLSTHPYPSPLPPHLLYPIPRPNNRWSSCGATPSACGA
jgi:hypothetical protein